MNKSAKLLSGTLFFLSTWSGLSAQEVITPLAGNPQARAYHSTVRPIKKSAVADTLELPFFDDFSTTFVEPDQDLWSDLRAFINNNYCIDPVTNGVATLDALDFDGSIYAGATRDPVSFIADHMTSNPIQLAYTAGDSLYFSFLYQPRGLGDEPEEQDSLLVDFFSPTDTLWINVWGIPGTSLHAFRHVMIPVLEPRFLTNGFRFRFRNRASLPRNNDYPDKMGNVDHWNLDYERIDLRRVAADTILRDVAFNTPLKSPLKELTSIPWSHFEAASNTVMDENISVRYRNNDTIARNVTRSLVIEEPLYGETYVPGDSTAQDLPALKDTVVKFEYIYPIDHQRGDSAIVRFKASLRTDAFDPKVNDTVVYDQLFSDFYAYDDGTPEAGYGLRGQGTGNGNVAVKYKAYQPDEIGGVDIQFNQLLDSVNLGYYFKLMVWDDNDGVPGIALLDDENGHTPGYTTRFPGFIRYHFSEPVHVDGIFYVGWKQNYEFILNVGMDMNNIPDPHVMYYNYQGTWVESGAPGVILLRPFLYDETTGVPSRERQIRALLCYPNPASDRVHITIPGSRETAKAMVDLFDVSGRLVKQGLLQNESLDVSGFPEGIYFLRMRTGKGIFYGKLVIKR